MENAPSHPPDGDTATVKSVQVPRLKLIVIHGVGGAFVDAVKLAQGLLSFECVWENGDFLVHRRMGMVLRRLLQAEDAGSYASAFQMLVISRFLAAPLAEGRWQVDASQTSRFSERKLREDFGFLGLPATPALRARRAGELEAIATRDLHNIRPVLDQLAARLTQPDGSRLTETEAREAIRSTVKEDGGALVEFLEALRDMQETGGDLDTVASAALYAYWLRSRDEAGADLRYGRDYRFVFLNYHENLSHLEVGAPADVLMADLPIGAFPDFAAQARGLATRDVHVERYEDHHPHTRDHVTMFEQLKSDGIVALYDLCGPVLGEAHEDGEPQCGADLVYANTIKGMPFDCPGAERVRSLAHSEDFVTDRTETSRALTSLIKGGHCKAEIAELLVDSIPGNDLDDRLNNAGWRQHVIDWQKGAYARSGELEADVFMLHVGDADPQDESETTCVIMVLAPPPVAGGAALHTGAVTEFMARKFPEADYLFYCYGASLLVARRLNSGNVLLDLSRLMPLVGTSSDGGHSGAAVCRPEANPAYPHQRLKRVTPANFGIFAKYMARRLRDAGFAVRRVEDRSAPAARQPRAGQGALLVVVVAALTIGLMLVIFSPKFRPASILESNADFLPQMDAAGGPQP